MDRPKLDLIRGTLDVLILKALAWGPQHGYSVTSFIRAQSDEALLVEEGTLYPALWRLESRKLVEAEWGLSENNRKAKFYRLTAAGRRHLHSEARTWHAYAAAVAKVLAATEPLPRRKPV
jgi:transcriptional regulator